MPFAGGYFHQSVRAVPLVEPERLPHQQQGGSYAEADAEPLADTCHKQDDEHHKDGEQAARKDEEVLTFQPFELHWLADTPVDGIFRHSPIYKKNDLRIVAATIRKIHAPNHEAAVFEVSGSPLENLL